MSVNISYISVICSGAMTVWRYWS